MNSINLTGRVTKDIELRQTNTGKNVVSFNLAVEDHRHKNSQGKNSVYFFRCVGWQGIARTLNTYAKKGSLIGISGSLIISQYQKETGEQVRSVEVLIENLDLLASSKNSQASDDSKATLDAPEPETNQQVIQDVNSINGLNDASSFAEEDNGLDLPY